MSDEILQIGSQINAMHNSRQIAHDKVEQLFDLFTTDSHAYSDEQLALFDKVFEPILDSLEDAALEVLSQQMSATKQAPPKLLERFCLNPSVLIAGPVLQLHPQVPQDILLEVAQNRGDSHLKYLALRQNLPATVTEPIVERGSNIVLSRIIDNKTAEFSKDGLDHLVERSAKIDILAEKLSLRTDLSHSAISKLISLASTRLKEKLKIRFPDHMSTVDSVVDSVSDSVATKSSLITYDFHSARKRYLHIKTTKRATERDLLYMIKQKDIEATIVVLSDMASLPYETITKLLNDSENLSVLALMKSLNLNWETTQKLMIFREELLHRKFDRENAGTIFGNLDTTLALSVIDAKCYKKDHKFN